jgi:hypothetical protein
MSHPEHTANTASTSKMGRFATLCAFLHINGTGAPSGASVVVAPVIEPDPMLPDGQLHAGWVSAEDECPRSVGESDKVHRETWKAECERRRGQGAHTRSFHRPVLATLLATLGALAFTAAPAFAASPEQPTTEKASLVTTTSATLNGLLNPNAKGQPGSYQFDYAPAEAGECNAAGLFAPASPAFATGAEKEAVSESVTGLEANKQYAFCVVAFSLSLEASTFAPEHFTTLKAAPGLSGEKASGVGSTKATLEAQLNPNNEATSYTFEYASKEKAGELEAPIVKLPVGGPVEGGTNQTIGTPAIEGLSAGTTYFYRVVATNGTGTTDATVTSFTTVPTPTIEVVEPSSITATSAAFKGTLTPLNSVDTKYSFEYAPSPECAGAGTLTTTPGDAGTGLGTTFKTPATPVTELQPNQTYSVCLVSINAFGSEATPPVTFKTPAASPSIEVGSVKTSGETPFEATLEAQVNPNNQTTTYGFEYSTSNTLAGAITLKGTSSLSGYGYQTASVPTGHALTPGTTYYFRVLATNATGTTTDPTIAEFKTPTAVAPNIESETSSGLTAEKATLEAGVNPEHQATTCKFEYGTEPALLTGVTTVACLPQNLGSGGSGVVVSAPLAGLKSSTAYYYRVSATNETGTTTDPKIETFTTESAQAPKIEELSATEVASSSATFDATIDPGGLATAYTFEYAPAGGTFTPVPEPEAKGTIAEGTAGVQVSVHMQQGLLPDASYQFRVLVSNSFAAETGEAQTFTTHAAGGEFKLPDDRAWEQVSPVDKLGARVTAITKEGGVIQAAENGSAITYVTSAPPVPNAEGNVAVGESQIISKRGEGGWSSRDITTPHEKALYAPPVGDLAEYLFFSPNLSTGLVEPSHGKVGGGNTPLSSPATEAEIYIREGLLEREGAHYLPLGDAFEGASGNLEHVIFTGDEWTAGTVFRVFMPPEGETVREFSLGSQPNVRNAVSEDGQRVFFESEGDSQPRLFMRDVAEGKTVRLDLPQGGAKPTGFPNAKFQYATPNGSKVYFTDPQALTPNSTAAGELELYEYNTLTGVLTDLTPNPAGTTGTGVDGVVGVSESGEYVYFVASATLSPGAHAGAANLYVEHIAAGANTIALVAVLSGDDAHDWSSLNDAGNEFRFITSRVSPNGRYFAFMSDRSLTGYDNRDSVSGARDQEVFEYDADTGKVSCASCDPTGARPHGVFDPLESERSGEGLGLLVDRPLLWEGRWLGGSIPGWTAFGYAGAQYQSRYLSNNGRLFFNGADALVPQDTNGKEDVYEYEPEGLGPEHARCGPEAASGSEVYKPGSAATVEGRPVEEGAGCVALISSGSSSTESAFLDASGRGPGGEEAEDVFFLTASKLVPQDVDTADDVYDAHVCSSAVPCASSAVVSPPCTTTDSCRVAPAAQPSIYGAPASATFAGQGNAAPITTIPKKVTKKAVKCKKNFTKNKKGKCIRTRTKKKAKRASRNRRTQR